MKHLGALGPCLGRAAHLSKGCMDRRMAQYDITAVQNHVLMYLHHSGGQAPQCEVTAHLKVKPSTVNGILDRMADKGLVERSVSGSDARRRLISITAKGTAQYELTERKFQEVEELLLRGFTEAEAESFKLLLGRVIENLEVDQL